MGGVEACQCGTTAALPVIPCKISIQPFKHPAGGRRACLATRRLSHRPLYMQQMWAGLLVFILYYVKLVQNIFFYYLFFNCSVRVHHTIAQSSQANALVQVANIATTFPP